MTSWFLILIQITDAIPYTSNQKTHDPTFLPEIDNPGYPMLPENEQSNLEASSVYIPSDQMKMIQNINELISEVWFLSAVSFLQFYALWPFHLFFLFLFHC